MRKWKVLTSWRHLWNIARLAPLGCRCYTKSGLSNSSRSKETMNLLWELLNCSAEKSSRIQESRFDELLQKTCFDTIKRKDLTLTTFKLCLIYLFLKCSRGLNFYLASWRTAFLFDDMKLDLAVMKLLCENNSERFMERFRQERLMEYDVTNYKNDLNN